MWQYFLIKSIHRNTLKLEMIHEGKKAYECDNCYEVFQSKKVLDEHKMSVHEGKEAIQMLKSKLKLVQNYI